MPLWSVAAIIGELTLVRSVVGPSNQSRATLAENAIRRLGGGGQAICGSFDPMATVLIIGASKGIGVATVNAALKASHSVRALSRSVSSIR